MNEGSSHFFTIFLYSDTSIRDEGVDLSDS